MNSEIMTTIMKNTNSVEEGSRDCHTLLLIQNSGNFRRSGEPVRFMYYEEGGSWVDFRNDVFGWLRSGFLEGKAMVEVEMEGLTWIFDFYRMVQIDLESGYQRSIAWIDVNGKCFFPKKFVCGGDKSDGEPIVKIANVKENLSSGNPKIEIDLEIIIGGHSWNLGKRKRESDELETKVVNEEKAEGSSSNGQWGRAKRRQLIDSAAVDQPRWPKAKLLKEEERAFSMVKSLFLSVLGIVEPDATITAIHQCLRTAPLDRARFEVFQKQVESIKNARGDANVTFAWHGTSAKGMESILTHGFGMPSMIPGSESLGIGIYLSPIRSPHISAMLSEVDDNGEKHLVLCRVILGKCEKVEAGSKQLYPSSVDFDTGVDDVQNPGCYVVWCANMNTHILPECVVSYKSSGPVKGQFNVSSTTKWISHPTNLFLGKLFSKLGSSVPPSKIQQLRALCSTYKNGRLGKDFFVKQLRSVVGDEMLRSTIHEFRG